MTEHVSGLQPLRSALQRLPDTSEKAILAYRVGTVLATVHSSLVLAPAAMVLLPPPFDRIDVVPIHGDFGLTNVQIRSSDSTIYVLDWSTPDWLGTWCTHGSATWDIAMLLTDLMYQRPFDPNPVSHSTVIARAFLSGYNEVKPYVIREHREQIFEVARSYYRAARWHGPAYLRLPSLTRLVML